MDSKKLAEALREASRESASHAFAGALWDAAAAFEEEGERDQRTVEQLNKHALALRAHADRFDRHNERIEALEAQANLKMVIGGYPLRTTAPPVLWSCKHGVGTKQCINPECQPDTAPPPAPEERLDDPCNNAGCLRGRPHNRAYCRTPAAALAAPSVSEDTPPAPEYATDPDTNRVRYDVGLPPLPPPPEETCAKCGYKGSPCKCMWASPEQAQERVCDKCGKPDDTGRGLAFESKDEAICRKCIVTFARGTSPPEQARRTWENVSHVNGAQVRPIAPTVTELRPGERIVGGAEAPSGGVKGFFVYAEDVPAHVQDMPATYGTFYPERTSGAPEAEGRNAPPRAEGDEFGSWDEFGSQQKKRI